MKMPRYQATFTLSPQEALDAKKRVRAFRFGGAQGVVGIILLCLLFAYRIYILVLSFTLIFDPGTREGPSDPILPIPFHPIIPILFAVGLCIFAYWCVNSFIRYLTKHCLPLLPDGIPATVSLFDSGIQFSNAGDARVHPWSEFTALIFNSHCFIILTLTSFLSIPKRSLDSSLHRDFEIYVRGMCLKQGKSNNFPIVADAPVALHFQQFPPPTAEGPDSSTADQNRLGEIGHCQPITPADTAHT